MTQDQFRKATANLKPATLVRAMIQGALGDFQTEGRFYLDESNPLIFFVVDAQNRRVRARYARLISITEVPV